VKNNNIPNLINYWAYKGYNKFIIYKNLYNTTLEESIKEIMIHDDRHGIFDAGLKIKNKIIFKELIINFNKGWKAVDYNIFKYNCQDFVAHVIDIIQAYRHLPSRKILHSVDILKVILKQLQKNEDTSPGLSEYIPLVNSYYIYRCVKDQREFKKEISKL
jgi:hypothetical protein